MKQILKSIFTTLVCLSVTSCNNSKEKANLIFSEIIEGSSNNRAVEIYNISDKDVDLSEYKIDIQLNSGTKTVALEGTLKSKETYVIVYEKSSEELKEKADLISSDLMFIGAQPLELKYKDKTIDVLGSLEGQFDFCKDLTLVRKVEFLEPKNIFDEYDWIRYNLDNYKYLGTIEASITNQELLDGPKLTEEDFNRPYYIKQENGTFLGGGGVMDVTVKSYVDGDTTCFYYDKHRLDTWTGQFTTEIRTVYENDPRIIWNSQFVDTLVKLGFMDRDDWDEDRIETISYAMSLEDYIDRDENFFPAFNRIIQKYVFDEKGFVKYDVGRRFEIRSDIPEEQKKIDEHFEKLASLEPLCRKFVEEYKRLKKETIKQLEVGRDLEKNLSRYSRLEFPLTSAVLYNKNVLAWALIKQGKTKCNLDRVCPFLLNGEIEDIKMIKELITYYPRSYEDRGNEAYIIVSGTWYKVKNPSVPPIDV